METLGVDRYRECLDVLRRGFATVTDEYGITAANTPSNPAFWPDDGVAQVVAKGFTLFGLVRHDVVVGCAFVGPSKDSSRWSLRHLAVAPEARHAGIGEALVAEAARRAREAGGSHLVIGIVAQNTRLAQWYHRLGFVTIESDQRYPGLVFGVDRLELALTPLSAG